jgi:hypothetical protein
VATPPSPPSSTLTLAAALALEQQFRDQNSELQRCADRQVVKDIIHAAHNSQRKAHRTAPASHPPLSSCQSSTITMRAGLYLAFASFFFFSFYVTHRTSSRIPSTVCATS